MYKDKLMEIICDIKGKLLNEDAKRRMPVLY